MWNRFNYYEDNGGPRVYSSSVPCEPGNLDEVGNYKWNCGLPNVMKLGSSSVKKMATVGRTLNKIKRNSWYAKPDGTFEWQVTTERAFHVEHSRSYPIPAGEAGSLLLGRYTCDALGLVYGSYEDGFNGLYSDIQEVFEDIRRVTG